MMLVFAHDLAVVDRDDMRIVAADDLGCTLSQAANRSLARSSDLRPEYTIFNQKSYNSSYAVGGRHRAKALGYGYQGHRRGLN